MQTQKLAMPYDSELVAEMNAERYEMLKSGQIQFSHPEDSHDDRLWALALACYGTRLVGRVPKFQVFAAFGHVIKPSYGGVRERGTLFPSS